MIQLVKFRDLGAECPAIEFRTKNYLAAQGIYPKSCTSRYCVKLTSSGKCEIIEIAQRRQIWPSDTQRN
jgi:hypothetical protein